MDMCLLYLPLTDLLYDEPRLMSPKKWELRMDPEDHQPGSGEHSTVGQALTKIATLVQNTVINVEIAK